MVFLSTIWNSGSAISVSLLAWAVRPGSPRGRLPARGWGGWVTDPRHAVLVALGVVMAVGIGRKLLQARRARAAVARLGDPAVRPEEVEAVARHQRAGLLELFRLLGTAAEPAVRDAAGRALAALWAQDQLIAEEEQAVARRGFAATWRARRRYPRDLRGPIPIAVDYGIPFVRDGGPGIQPENLEWSHRIAGARRASLEQFTPWRAGPGRAAFTVEPGDFPTPGPHRLVLQARVRTKDLTSKWELELPHLAFSFELDPSLTVESLLALPDAGRAEQIAAAVRLERSEPESDQPITRLGLTPEFNLGDQPTLAIRLPLPCDLAHSAALELEGVAGRIPAGQVLLAGQGGLGGESDAAGVRQIPLTPAATLPLGAIDRPGERRLRAALTPEAPLGWTDPDIRSVWPEPIVTDWVVVRIIRL